MRLGIEPHARRTPAAVALRTPAEALTYAALQARIEAMAAMLAAAGIGAG